MIQKSSIEAFIDEKITKGEEISPFLFVSKDLSKADDFAQKLALELSVKHGVDKNFIFHLQAPEEESLKIEQVRQFLEHTTRSSSFAFQVFIIHNIATLTLQSANAMLKFLEEPGVGNIVFLTNQGEGGVLDTILSRVKVIPLGSETNTSYNQEMYSMIKKFIEKSDPELFQFFYSAEINQNVAKEFLLSLLEVGKTSKIPAQMYSEIEEDITGLEKNNLLPKYIVDKYLAFLSQLYAR